MTETDGNGCESNPTTVTLEIYSLPTADFTYTFLAGGGCGASTALFDGNVGPAGSNNGSGVINYWDWNFGDPINPQNTWTSSVNGNSDHLYGPVTGPYDVTLIVTDNYNCVSAPQVNSITLWPTIQASFSAPPPVCFGDLMTFNASASTGSSTGGVVSYEYVWTFGSNPQDTVSSPINTISSNIFGSYGPHDVTLTTIQTYATGPPWYGQVCTSTETQQIYIWDLPNTLFSSNSTACEGNLSDIQNNSSDGNDAPISSYDWTYDASGSPISFTPPFIFPNNGVFNVDLTATDANGCSNTYNGTILVVENPTAQISNLPISGCDGECIVLNDASNNPSGIPLVEWNYTFTTGTVVTYCLPDNSTLDNTSIEYSGPGTYLLDLAIEDANGCVSITSEIITVYNNPTALIAMQNSIQCKYEPIEFCDNSTLGDASIYIWNWNWNNLAATCTTLPADTNCEILTFNSAAMHIISLDVVDTNGCYDNDTITVLINDQPVADFSTIMNICPGDSSSFNNLSTAGLNGNGLLQWDWTFTSVAESFPIGNPAWNYDYKYIINETIGEYVTATLIVKDSISCKDTLTKIITVHPVPVIDIDITEYYGYPCEGDTLIFNGIGSSMSNFQLISPPDNNIIVPDSAWNFNSTIYSDEWNIFEYPSQNLASGLYTIALTLENSNYGCSATKIDTVRLLNSPDINNLELLYSTTPACGDSITVNIDANINANQTAVILEYPIGIYDTIGTGLFPISYLSPFPYVYGLDINLLNINGCETKTDTFLHIHPEPIALFSPRDTNGCAPFRVKFTFESEIDTTSAYNNTISYYDINPDTIAYWIWDFDDDSIVDGYNTIYHTYDLQSISYQPTLTITTNYGCTSSDLREVIVNPTPEAELNISSFINGRYEFDASESAIMAPTSDFWYFWTINTTGLESDSISPINQPPWEYTSDINDYPGDNVAVWEYIYANSFDMINAESEVCVIIENKTGHVCQDTACITIRDIINFNGLWVPNAIYLDNSSFGHSEFKPKGKSISKYELLIFDKFGNLVFETTKVDEKGSPMYGWNGTNNGMPLPQGTYIWKIYAEFSDGTIWPGTGVGFGAASNPEDDPWKKSNQVGLHSGTLYLIR